MPKLNEQKVELLQSGKVVLYTGDKKGSDEVKELLRKLISIEEDIEYISGHYFIGEDSLSGEYNWLRAEELNNRPIHPIEWFYEEEITYNCKLTGIGFCPYENTKGNCTFKEPCVNKVKI